MGVAFAGEKAAKESKEKKVDKRGLLGLGIAGDGLGLGGGIGLGGAGLVHGGGIIGGPIGGAALVGPGVELGRHTHTHTTITRNIGVPVPQPVPVPVDRPVPVGVPVQGTV